MARDETIKLSLIDGVTRTLSQIQQGVSGVGASLTKLNQGAELAAKGFGLIGAAASSIGNAVQGAADIETALSRVADITRATADEQVALQKAVGDAVSTLGVSANDAANALLLMSEDGFSAADAIGSLNTVLAFAKANAQDAATATQALGGVLDTFGEKPQIIGKLADQLTAASRAAGTGAKSLQDGLAAIGIQAEQAGLSVGDAVAVLAALSARGREGTQAAKDVGTALSEINNPASAAAKALKEAGLSGRSFTEIIAVLSNDSAKAAPLLEALGKNPRAAMKLLLDEGGASLTKFQGIVNDTGDASVEAAKKVDETFNGAVAKLQNSFANLRNEFLSPILKPLADEAVALAEKINALGDSPQFARIRDQFQELATNAIRAVGDLIEKADLEAWAGNVAEFGTEAKLVFDDVAYVAGKTAGAIRDVSFAIKFLRGDKDLFSDSVDSLADGTERLGRAGADAGDTIADLGGNLASGERQTRSLVSEVLAAVGRLKEFASSMIEVGNAVAGAGDAAAGAAEDLRRVPEAAKLTVGTLGDAARAAELAGLSLDQLQKKLAQVRDDLGKTAPGTAQFDALAKEAAALEAQISKTREKIDEAANSTDKLGRSADSTSGSLRNFASAASDAGDAAADLKSSNSQVADSFGNIGNQSSETAISLGTLTEEFVRQALEAAGAAKSAKDYIDTLNRYFAAGADQEEKIKARLDQLSRLNSALSEEEQIRKRLALQYGTSSTLLDELVRKELELARAKKQANDEADRGIEIEQRRNAGGVNFGQPAAAAESGATSSRGSAAGGGRSAPQIVINVQGMTTDQARAFVEQSVVPELDRINRLSR